jgi:membrane protein
LVLLLVWVYYSAQILFFGAELTQVYARRHGSRLGLAADAAVPARVAVAAPAAAPVDAPPSPHLPSPPPAAVGRGLAISAVLLLIGLLGKKKGRS